MENSVDMSSLLSALSGNPAISELLAGLLGGSQGKAATGGAEPQPPQTAYRGEPSAEVSPAPPLRSAPASTDSRRYGSGAQGQDGIDPALLSLLSSMLSSSAGQKTDGGAQSHNGAAEHTEHAASPSLSKLLGAADDPIKKLLGGKTESENRIRLLNALRPYLGEERREKLDVILKLLKIAELGQLSGLLKSL